MLSIGKMGAGQERYYLDKVAEGAEDYYSGEGEAEGYWLGDAARELGLEGKVQPAQLVAMLTGTDPASGEPLGLRHVSGGGVPGFDLTFSAPKSVSVLWALGGGGVAAEVKAAHAEAVKAGLGYLQESACWTRRGAGGHLFLQGNGFLAAGYVHRSSRAGDMQLHTHVLVANATFAEGRWTRLYHPAIYEHAKTAGYVYEAHLRHELGQRLGVRWQGVVNGLSEIEGFDPDHLAAFSTRRAEILEAAGGEGASARSMQIATLATRKTKDRDLTAESLRELWREKAAEIGLTQEEIRKTLGHEPRRDELSVAEVEAAVTAHASHFERRDVIQAVAECLPNGAPGDEVARIADRFLAQPQVMEIVERPRAARFTTKAIWEMEQRALSTAQAMAERSDRAVVSEIVVSRILDQRPSMKPDQRVMVERLLGRGEGLVLVIGEAGTGKTYALVAAAHAWSAQGTELRVAAPTWRAANVLRSEGLPATSVASLLAEFQRAEDRGEDPLARASVLVVDEAGMVDSGALSRLIAHAEAAEAKLVLIGDPAQLGEIGAGGLFAAIAHRTEPIVLDEVIRHHHALEREGAKLIREGQGREALSIYEGAQRVTVSDDAAARREAMVADWWQSYQKGEDALMIAKRNAEVAELNARARAAMKAAGRLKGEEIEVGGARFAAGDQIITRINDRKAHIYNRERWRVAEVEAKSGRMVLDGIDTRGRVCVDAVYLGRLRERDGGPAIEHAYAATTYQAQGSTVDKAFVMADPSMTRQEFYVATSRSREETRIYATPEVQSEREEFAPRSAGAAGLDHIAKAAERDGSQAAAHDAALRSRYADLPSARLRELASEAGAEAHAQQLRGGIAKDLEESAERLRSARAEREALPEPRRWEGKQERREREWAEFQLRGDEEAALHWGERLRAEAAKVPEVRHEARAESAVIESVLAERERLAVAAARLSPADYITREIGERPSDPDKAREWDGAVRDIEGYRLRNGVVDRDSALGPEPKHGHYERSSAQESLERAQRNLGLRQEQAVERSAGMDLSI
jgi:conjugative relaxase-like TrwC/TraI family protein